MIGHTSSCQWRYSLALHFSLLSVAGLLDCVAKGIGTAARVQIPERQYYLFRNNKRSKSMSLSRCTSMASSGFDMARHAREQLSISVGVLTSSLKGGAIQNVPNHARVTKNVAKS